MPAPAPPAPGLGAFLRDRRQELDLSQDEVAAALGLHQTTVSGWERGQHLDPMAKHIKRLAMLLRVEPTDLRDLWWDALGGYLAAVA